jgi:Flp pilus assembly protein TadG
VSASARSLRALPGDASGASALEFGMIAPLLIILLFGVFQIGWALHCASSVRYALEESARSLSIDQDITAAEVETAMRSRLDDFADPEISVTISEDTSTAGLHITNLHATYVHALEAPLLPAWELRFQSVAAVARPA